jgi:hypothetical protein
MYIGVYDNVLYASHFPLILPTFSAISHVTTSIDDPFTELRFELQYNGYTIAETVLRDIKHGDIMHLPEARRYMAMSILQIRNATIEQEGHLQVIATTERETLGSLKLKLLVASHAQSTTQPD